MFASQRSGVKVVWSTFKPIYGPLSKTSEYFRKSYFCPPPLAPTFLWIFRHLKVNITSLILVCCSHPVSIFCHGVFYFVCGVLHCLNILPLCLSFCVRCTPPQYQPYFSFLLCRVVSYFKSCFLLCLNNLPSP